MNEEAKATYEFYVAGVKFHNLHEVIHEMEVDDKLILTLEPTNKFDSNAVRIEYASGTDVVMTGYVPKKISAEVAALLTVSSATCTVIELNKEEKPWKQLKVKIEEVKKDV